MPGGYGIDPRMLVGRSANSGGVPYAQPDYQGLMTQLAYKLAGAPPQTDRRMTIPSNPLMPSPSDIIRSGGGGGGISMPPISTINQGYKAIAGGGDPAIQQPSQLNELGSKLGLTSGLSAGWGSGANLNAAVQSQLGGAVTPLGTAGGIATAAAPAAVLAGNLGTIGSGAAANAALAEAGFGSGAAAGAGASAGSGASGLLAGSGAATAIPVAGLAWAAADLINKSINGDGSAKRNDAAFMAAFPGTQQHRINLGRTAAAYTQLPDGRLISYNDYRKLAGAYYGAAYAPDGNQEQWMKQYQDLLKNTPTAQLPKGYSWDGTKIVKGF